MERRLARRISGKGAEELEVDMRGDSRDCCKRRDQAATDFFLGGNNEWVYFPLFSKRVSINKRKGHTTARSRSLFTAPTTGRIRQITRSVPRTHSPSL